MIKIDSYSHKILQSCKSEEVGLFDIDVPTSESIRTIDLQVGNTVEVKKEKFEILSVSLNHQLLDPPIPVLVLKCRKIDQ